MTTSTADAPLQVSTDGSAGPYIVVTSEQIAPVTEALRAEGIRFHIDQEAVLLSGAPALAVIDLGIGADVLKVQNILGRVSSDLQRNGKKDRRRPTRQELIVRGERAAMQELRTRFDIEPQDGWNRRLDVEARFRQTLPSRTLTYCFSKLVPNINRDVAVLIQGRTPGEELYLSSIVPLTGRGQLDPVQRDQVVVDFRDTFLKQITHNLGVRILDRSVSARSSLEQLLSPIAAARFQTFSTLANKNILHPQDQQRWDEFVGQTHRDDMIVDLEQLDEWLADEGFPPELRKDLVSQFDSGRRLLATYDEERSP